MPIYDTSILALLLAGQGTAVTDALEQDHPDAFLQFTGSLGEWVTQYFHATSGSSLTIATGPQVLTLDAPRMYPTGVPVRLMRVGEESTHYMVGTVTSEVDGVLTVEVTEISGSGTYTSWSVVPIDHASSVVSPPVSIADGGTAADTTAGARSNLGVTRTHEILSIESTPPGSPNTGDRHLVGDNPSGAFVGHENEIATWSGSAWTFVAPTAGELAYDENARQVYLHTGAALVTGGLWLNSEWRSLVPSGIGYINISTPYSPAAGDLAADTYLVLPATLSSNVLTLPEDAPLGVRVTVRNDVSATSLTINVSGGKLIDGASSVSVAVEGRIVLVRTETNAANDRWTVISLYEP